MEFHLAKANKQDWNFIWSLRVATMKAMTTQSYGWDETTQRSYAEESLSGEIVIVEDEPVGVITLSDWGDQLHLTWIAILPRIQGKGLGTQLIQYCQQKAISKQKPLTLQVLRNNPAISLYKRCGFELCNGNDTYKLRMVWADYLIPL